MPPYRSQIDETMAQNALCVDSSFMSLIPIPMAVGDRNSVLETISSVIISQSFADKWFPEGNAVGNTLDITIDNGKASLTVTGIFEDMERTVLPQCDMIYKARTVYHPQRQRHHSHPI